MERTRLALPHPLPPPSQPEGGRVRILNKLTESRKEGGLIREGKRKDKAQVLIVLLTLIMVFSHVPPQQTPTVQLCGRIETKEEVAG